MVFSFHDQGVCSGRRGFLQQAAAASAVLPFAAMAAQVEALQDLGRSRGLHIGAAAEDDMPSTPQQYQELFLRHCELFAANLSWGRIEARHRVIDTSSVGPTLGFSFLRGLKLTGCHLLWYELFPEWIKGIPHGDEMNRVVLRHVTETVSRFRGRTFSWNVLNEAINPQEGRADGLRIRGLLDTLDLQTIDLAFHAAREADPEALLIYNDYDFYADTPWHESRRQALLRLLDTFSRNRTPVDGVGLQSHLKLDESTPFNELKYRTFLSELASRNLKVIISELDVFNASGEQSAQKLDRMVADLYARFLSTALDERAVIAVVFWSLSDRYSWLRDHGRGLQRPLLLDDRFWPKPAFDVTVRALRNAPDRKR